MQAAGMGTVLAHVCNIMRFWILYNVKKLQTMLVILSMPKTEFALFTLVCIAKVASQEVRPRRVGESLGAPHVDDLLLKPLFLCSERKRENRSMNAIIDVHEISVGVAFGEQ